MIIMNIDSCEARTDLLSNLLKLLGRAADEQHLHALARNLWMHGIDEK